LNAKERPTSYPGIDAPDASDHKDTKGEGNDGHYDHGGDAEPLHSDHPWLGGGRGAGNAGPAWQGWWG